MKNTALTLQYKGTNYHGWQRQENGITIQQCIEDAIEKLTGEKTCVFGCGRTDAGVHAEEYTCNFHSGIKIPDENLPYALNHLLPGDICVKKAKTMPDSFHSRYDAVKKRYVYKIYNSEFCDVFLRDLTWLYRYDLNIELMREACRYFIGEHDFSAFCASGATVKDFVRTIYSLDVKKEGSLFIIDVSGNGFLYNMVRIIAGTLAYVGNGRIAPSDIKSIIASKDRTLAGVTAPPEGLYLLKAYYQKED